MTSTPSFTARAEALAALRALQATEAPAAEYAAPLESALDAITTSPDRKMQRRRQARHIRSALNGLDARYIASAIDCIARYP